MPLKAKVFRLSKRFLRATNGKKKNTFGYRPLARFVYYIEFQITGKNPNNPTLLYGLSRYFRQNKNEAKPLYYENLLYQQQSKHKKITN